MGKYFFIVLSLTSFKLWEFFNRLYDSKYSWWLNSVCYKYFFLLYTSLKIVIGHIISTEFNEELLLRLQKCSFVKFNERYAFVKHTTKNWTIYTRTGITAVLLT